MFHVPSHIGNLRPYVPGSAYSLKPVRLDSNENPYGPSPLAIDALKSNASGLHRYPDGSARVLKEVLSKTLQLSLPEIVAGNGSNELIDLLIRAYCVPGDSIVISRLAFMAYKMCAQLQNVEVIESALTPDFRTHLGSMLQLIEKNEKANLVFLANPNNPTGTYNTRDEMRVFLTGVSKVRGGSVLVVLDYAYWEYVTAPDLPDPLELYRAFKNVVVLHTFSKIHGLAGLRVGYGIANPEVTSTLEKVRQPFNVNSLGMIAGAAAMGDHDFVHRSKTLNTEALNLWKKELTDLGIPYLNSQGNFLTFDGMKAYGKTGPEIQSLAANAGVFFRPLLGYGLPNLLRASMGTPEENQIALSFLRDLKAAI